MKNIRKISWVLAGLLAAAVIDPLSAEELTSGSMVPEQAYVYQAPEQAYVDQTSVQVDNGSNEEELSDILQSSAASDSSGELIPETGEAEGSNNDGSSYGVTADPEDEEGAFLLDSEEDLAEYSEDCVAEDLEEAAGFLPAVGVGEGSSLENPVVITMGETYTRVWDKDTYSEDYFNKIVLQKKGCLSFQATKPKSSSGQYYALFLYLYNERGEAVWMHSTSLAKEDGKEVYSYQVGLPAGTYFLNLRAGFRVKSGKFRSNYRFDFTEDAYIEAEPNETRETASPLTPEQWTIGWFGTNDSSYNKEDFLSFEVDPSLIYRITMRGISALDAANVIIKLFRPESSGDDDYVNLKYEIKKNTDAEGNNYYEFEPSTGGAAYIELSDYKKEPIPYGVKITTRAAPTPTPTPSPSPTPTPTPVIQQAVMTNVYNSVNGGDLRWKQTEGADGYVVYCQRAAEGIRKVATINDVNTLQCYDTAIKDNCWGRVYHYYVCALYGTKEGPKSEKLVLQRLAPMKITSLQNSAAGTVVCKYTCTVKDNKALGYEVQYAESKADLFARSGTFKKVSVNGRNNLQASVKNLKKGKTYYFRVRCYVNYEHSVTHQKTKTWSQYSNVVGVKITKG